MAGRVVIVRTGTHLISLPFDHIDEILSADRIELAENLPEDAARHPSSEGESTKHWVFSRDSWLPVEQLLPGSDVSIGSQIVVVRWGDTGKAFAVDQVMGIETLGETASFPDRARQYTDIPITGVHFWNNRAVLELDLSRLISLDLGS